MPVESMMQGTIDALAGESAEYASDAELAAHAAAETAVDATKVDTSAFTDALALKADAADLIGLHALDAQIMGDNGTAVADGGNPLSYPAGGTVTHKWVERAQRGSDITIDGADPTKIVFARNGLYLAQLHLGFSDYHGTTFILASPSGDQSWDLNAGASQGLAVTGSSNALVFSWLFIPIAGSFARWSAIYYGASSTDHAINNSLVIGRIA